MNCGDDSGFFFATLVGRRDRQCRLADAAFFHEKEAADACGGISRLAVGDDSLGLF